MCHGGTVNLRTGILAALATIYGLTGVIADLTEHDQLFNAMTIPVSAVAVILVLVAIACGIAYVLKQLSAPLLGILESACALAPMTLATPWVVSPAYGLSLAGPSQFFGTLQSGMNPLVVFGIACFFVCGFLPMTVLALRGRKLVWLAVAPLVAVEVVMLLQIDLRAFVMGVSFVQQVPLNAALYAPVGGPMLRALAVVGAVAVAWVYRTTKSSGST